MFRFTLHTVPRATRSRWLHLLVLALIVAALAGCSAQPTPPPAASYEEEALARTEFTARIENFFEYAPLKVDETSQFLVHLTDLTDGTPVARATVILTARPAQGGPTSTVTARVGRVTGIYVADVRLPQAGEYTIEFHVRNATLDERMRVSDFQVEPR